MSNQDFTASADFISSSKFPCWAVAGPGLSVLQQPRWLCLGKDKDILTSAEATDTSQERSRHIKNKTENGEKKNVKKSKGCLLQR